MSRKIEDLIPAAQEKYHAFESAMHTAGLKFLVTCTLRTQAEQDLLYAQGRTSPGPIVTKVRHSEHSKGTAFDICMLDALDRPVWAQSAYVQAGKIGESVGLTWGGDWNHNGKSDDESFIDMPHFQLT